MPNPTAFKLTYSQDARESKPVRLLRRALKAALGFDFIHTWRNRDEMLRSDVIWTHTEQEWLSAALMLLLSGRKAGAEPAPCCWRKACGCSINGLPMGFCVAGCIAS